MRSGSHALTGLPAGRGPVSASTASGSTLVLTNGTRIAGDYDPTWANGAFPRGVGWDPVSNEIWTGFDQEFGLGFGDSAPISVYNVTSQHLASPILLGGGSLGSPVIPLGFVYDPLHGEFDVIDQGGRLDLFNATSAPTHGSPRPISLGGAPFNGAMDPKTGLLWVTDPIANRIDLVNVTSDAVTTMPLSGAWSVAYDAPADQMLVGTLSNLSAFDAATGAPVAALPLPSEGLTVNPVNGTIYTASGGPNVSVVAAPSDHLTVNLSEGEYIVAVAYDPAASTILALDGGTDRLCALAGPNCSSSAATYLGHGANVFAVDDASDRTFVPLSAEDNMSVLNSTTLATVAYFPLGAYPVAVLPEQGSGDLLLPDPLEGGLWVVRPGPVPVEESFLPITGAVGSLGYVQENGAAWDPSIDRTLVALP
ncbi:MAG: hypothetical protein L3J91_02065, partial [Thermoplasmata archaeon]|nr:hypothetical protein [Thermoplasmata archaeon]